MFKEYVKGFAMLLVLSVFFVGCTTSDVQMRRYVMEKDRVDQQMEGNAGYLGGTPIPEDRSQYKKTRKIYVLEVNQEADGVVNDELYERKKVIIEETESSQEQSEATDASSFQPRVQIPSFDNDQTTISSTTSSPGQPASYVDYKVEKDDTLQKISKKFYNSYSKWPKIYEANRSVIKTPDDISPGTMLRIPVE